MGAIRKIVVYDHEIMVDPSWANTPIEKVYYDGREVSSKPSVFGASHRFEVFEGFEQAVYEVDIGVRSLLPLPLASVTIRRNGKLVFTDKV